MMTRVHPEPERTPRRRPALPRRAGPGPHRLRAAVRRDAAGPGPAALACAGPRSAAAGTPPGPRPPGLPVASRRDRRFSGDALCYPCRHLAARRRSRPVAPWPPSAVLGRVAGDSGFRVKPGTHALAAPLDLLLDAVGEVGVVVQESSRVLLALPQLLAQLRRCTRSARTCRTIPCSTPRSIEATLAADPAMAEKQDPSPAWRKGGETLFFTTFTQIQVTHRLGAVLERLDPPPHVKPDRRVELQRPPPRWSQESRTSHLPSPEAG